MPQPPAWELYAQVAAGPWVARGACNTTHRDLDFTAEATAVKSLAACAGCPVLDACAAWQADQAPEARSWGAVGGQWWGLVGTRGAKLATLNAERVQRRALAVIHDRSRLPVATAGQGTLWPPTRFRTATPPPHRRCRTARPKPVREALWIAWSEIAADLEAAA